MHILEFLQVMFGSPLSSFLWLWSILVAPPPRCATGTKQRYKLLTRMQRMHKYTFFFFFSPTLIYFSIMCIIRTLTFLIFISLLASITECPWCSLSAHIMQMHVWSVLQSSSKLCPCLGHCGPLEPVPLTLKFCLGVLTGGREWASEDAKGSLDDVLWKRLLISGRRPLGSSTGLFCAPGFTVEKGLAGESASALLGALIVVSAIRLNCSVISLSVWLMWSSGRLRKLSLHKGQKQLFPWPSQ